MLQPFLGGQAASCVCWVFGVPGRHLVMAGPHILCSWDPFSSGLLSSCERGNRAEQSQAKSRCCGEPRRLSEHRATKGGVSNIPSWGAGWRGPGPGSGLLMRNILDVWQVVVALTGGGGRIRAGWFENPLRKHSGYYLVTVIPFNN